MKNSAAIAAYRAARQNTPFTKLHWGVANHIGIQSALFIEIIQDWCDNNMIHCRNNYFHNEHWWTRGSYQEWEARYPSLGSERTLQRLLLKLESSGYVLSGQFNKGKDNTKFYRVNEEKIGELYLQAIEEFRQSNVPNWHDESKAPDPTCQIGTVNMPNWHGQHAKLARSTIYKQIKKIDQKTDITPPTPQGEEEGWEIPEEIASAIAVQSQEIEQAYFQELAHSETVTSLSNKSGTSDTEEPKVLSPVPPQFNKSEQANKREDPFLINRLYNQVKGTYMSNSFDPWMVSKSKPVEEFAVWVFETRYKDKPGKTLADAKAEIRNNCDRACDLWEDFQKFKQERDSRLSQRQSLEIMDSPPPQQEYIAPNLSPELLETVNALKAKRRKVS
ncbi:hypothetical protein ACX27_27375 [Nostoc piscinale CENA21]|uniref:Replication protein n=1 Tax=Nostoc piscinale CENA21 TaxID=224013 RepID=A0A0M5MHN5_9NOSO|nr:hypothetical protein [Nostoc piscinale]ALF55730.1 hypothetical protein ACX27_27375 [Nostoc piscinale CENA21]